jgi:hypothetical protein
MTEQERQKATDRPKSEFLDFEEALEYLKISKSTLAKYNMKNLIPRTKPNGRKVYYKITDLNNFLLRNPIKSEEQLERTAEMYFNKCDKFKAI